MTDMIAQCLFVFIRSYIILLKHNIPLNANNQQLHLSLLFRPGIDETYKISEQIKQINETYKISERAQTLGSQLGKLRLGNRDYRDVSERVRQKETDE